MLRARRPLQQFANTRLRIYDPEPETEPELRVPSAVSLVPPSP
jgi:hypothetical protein